MKKSDESEWKRSDKREWKRKNKNSLKASFCTDVLP